MFWMNETKEHIQLAIKWHESEDFQLYKNNIDSIQVPTQCPNIFSHDEIQQTHRSRR